MDALDIIFDSFGLYILGLVLLFGSYDILLRLRHGRRKKKIGLVFCGLFLLTMGAVFLILSSLFLARLYTHHQIFFYSGIVIFLVVGGVTVQVMRWKHEIMREDQKIAAGSGGSMPGQTARSRSDEKNNQVKGK